MDKLSAMKALLSGLIMVLTLGCASISVHDGISFMSDSVGGDPRLESPTPIFGGVSTDILGVGQFLTIPFRSGGRGYTDGWDFVFIPLVVMDVPFSFVADILYLPSDIAYWHHQSDLQKPTTSKPNSEHTLKNENTVETRG